MANDKNEKDPVQDDNKDAAVKPEPETLHTTDPQEHMEGPISSLIRKAGESFDTSQTKEESDQEKNEKK